MRSKLPLLFASAAIVAVALAGCSSTPAPSDGAGATSAGSKSAAPSAGTDVMTASNPLGTIVVNDRGMTAYVFDNDKANSGTSACSAACASTWPAITSTSATPTMTGITARVGTIPLAGGKFQVTIDGLPVYTYSGDGAAGSTAGQGTGGIWWVIDPSGKELKAATKGSTY